MLNPLILPKLLFTNLLSSFFMLNRFFFYRIAVLAPLFLIPMLSQAQSVSLGADFVNRYVWRGYDFGNSFSVQPDLSFSSGGFSIGSWASYSISADGGSADEHDLYASYSIGLPNSGSIDLIVTDYYFPNGGDWSNFDSDGEGAHWIELMGSVTLPESFPLTLAAAFMVHNDPDNSLYVEGSVPFSVADVEMGLTLGLVAGKSNFYGVTGTHLVNLGISAGKEIQITESFALPLFAGYIINPATDKSHLVFGFSL